MKILKCKVCERLRVEGDWYLPSELKQIPEGKLISSYCRFCVMEMSLSKNKEIVEKLKLRLIDIAQPLEEIGAELSIGKAAVMMTEINCPILGVIRDDKLAGVITEKDIVRRVIAKKMDPTTTVVASVMSYPVKTIRADASLPEATLKMSLEKLRNLVILRPERPHKRVSVRLLSETMAQVLSQVYTLGKEEGINTKKKK